MGAKTGYAAAILRVLGLRPGQGAAHYLWCEPDPGVRLLLEAYRDPDLAREAASIIRGWSDEDPRALWERLRAEGPPRGADPGDVGVPPREVARWLSLHRLTIPQAQVRGAGPADYNGGKPQSPEGQAADLARCPTLPATITPDARRVDPREVARWVWTWGRSYNTKGPDAGFLPSESSKGTPVWNAHPPEHFADAMGGLPVLPATITPDARRVDPREVARWLNVEAWLNKGRYMGPDRPSARREVEPDWTASITAAGLASRADTLPTLPATITPDARGIEPGPDLPPGTVAYMDPPYLGTTGYRHDLPRSEVVALARRWSAAGATVAISEAEPIADLTADGWSAVNITGQRVGQARTFSRQQAEWVTINRPPAWTPSEQCGLFG